MSNQIITVICAHLDHPESYSGFTLATSELCQTGLVSFSKADISRTTDTWQVSVVLLISIFENETKPVWHSSEVASTSVNTLSTMLVVN